MIFSLVFAEHDQAMKRRDFLPAHSECSIRFELVIRVLQTLVMVFNGSKRLTTPVNKGSKEFVTFSTPHWEAQTAET